MMDCNVTTNFLAELKRMHKESDGCKACPISALNNGENYTCDKFIRMCGDKAIEIVQEWSNAHQPKTRLSEFLEKYPKAKLYGASELPRFCVADLYGTTCEDMGMVGVGCAGCWNTPVDEQGVQ